MRKIVILFLLVLLCLILLGISPYIGPTKIDIINALKNPQSQEGIVFFKIRLPRVLLAFLVGASLSLGGAVFQSLFRNSLATPYTLGASSGSSLAVVIAIHLGLEGLTGSVPMTVIFALTGGLLFLFLLYFIMKNKHGFVPENLLLAGVTLGYLASAAILFIYYISSYGETQQMIYWTMGNLDTVGYRYVLIVIPAFLVVYPYLQYKAGALNLLSFGSDFAATRGVNVKSTQRNLLIMVSILISTCVSVSGPIGFVGLIIPHVIRRSLGADHRLLLPASVFAGGILLIFCDTIARSFFAPSDLPVGIITAIIGGPFFMFLLKKKSFYFK
ncbi:MAG: iron ABC transporter permease [Candidatus Coatesbacteria bacterium]|nr:iron ABC transporter permease [Candidatus Coatesbacteria bacterium]